MARLIPFDAEMFERARQAPQRFVPPTFNPPTGPSMQDVAAGVGVAQNVLSPIASALVSHVGESRRKTQEDAARAAFDRQQVGVQDLARKQAEREALATSNADYAADATQRLAQYGQQAAAAAPPAPVVAAPVATVEPSGLQVEAPPLAGPPDQEGNQQMPPLDWNARRAQLAEQMAARRAAQDVVQQAQVPAQPATPPEPMRRAEEAFQGTPAAPVVGRDVPAPKFMDRDELLVRAYMAGVSGDKAEKQAVLQGFKQLGEAAYAPTSIGEAFNPHEARKRALGELMGLMTPKGRQIDPTLQALHSQEAATSKERQGAIADERVREKASQDYELAQRKARAEREASLAESEKSGGAKDRKRLADAIRAESGARNADALAKSLMDVRDKQGKELTARQAYEIAKTSGEDERTALAVAQTYNQIKQGDLAAERTSHPERFRSNITVETPEQRRAANRMDADRAAAKKDAADAEKAVSRLDAEINELSAIATGAGKPSTALLRQYPDLGKAVNIQDRKDLAAAKLAGKKKTLEQAKLHAQKKREAADAAAQSGSDLPPLAAP